MGALVSAWIGTVRLEDFLRGSGHTSTHARPAKRLPSAAGAWPWPHTQQARLTVQTSVLQCVALAVALSLETF